MPKLLNRQRHRWIAIVYLLVEILLPLPLSVLFVRQVAQAWASQYFGALSINDNLALNFIVWPGILIIFWFAVALVHRLASRYLDTAGPFLILSVLIALGIIYAIALAVIT